MYASLTNELSHVMILLTWYVIFSLMNNCFHEFVVLMWVLSQIDVILPDSFSFIIKFFMFWLSFHVPFIDFSVHFSIGLGFQFSWCFHLLYCSWKLLKLFETCFCSLQSISAATAVWSSHSSFLSIFRKLWTIFDVWCCSLHILVLKLFKFFRCICSPILLRSLIKSVYLRYNTCLLLQLILFPETIVATVLWFYLYILILLLLVSPPLQVCNTELCFTISISLVYSL